MVQNNTKFEFLFLGADNFFAHNTLYLVLVYYTSAQTVGFIE